MDASQNTQAPAANEANSAGNVSNNAAGSAAGATSAGPAKDYGDKAFDYVAKKTGHSVSRSTSEKITDGLRSAFEKLTG